MRMSLTELYSVDQFADNDPLLEQDRPTYPPQDIVIDALIEHEAERFESFTRTLPSSKHRQVAWTCLYDKTRSTPEEFEMTKRSFDVMKREVKEAYDMFQRVR